MICAASYMGPAAPSLACQLAEQIRSKHRVAAYIFNRANEERKRMQEDYERACRAALEQGIQVPPKKRLYKIEEQCAVLVGGWPEVDGASGYLKKVRGWPLPELHLDERLTAAGLKPYDMKLRVSQKQNADGSYKVESDGVPVNPFLAAFVTRNPTVPPPSKSQSKFDPIWTKLNANEDYSLLKSPKPWTLVVKEYVGAGVLQPAESSSFLDKLGLGGMKLGEGLSAAGFQAHQLAVFLERLGFKAYVLHTRGNSIVTVGEFDSMDDPQLALTQDRLSRLSFKPDPSHPNAARFAQANLELFPRAIPMEVPRQGQ
jgi:hypothetical protein